MAGMRVNGLTIFQYHFISCMVRGSTRVNVIKPKTQQVVLGQSSILHSSCLNYHLLPYYSNGIKRNQKLIAYMVIIIIIILYFYFQITLTIQRVIQPKLASPVIHQNTLPKNDSHLIKLISGEAPAPSKPDLKNIPHVALYLTITSSEDDNEPDKVT